MSISDLTDEDRIIIKQLRTEIGYGIMDVAKAYCEAEGNADKAKELIKSRVPGYLIGI